MRGTSQRTSALALEMSMLARKKRAQAAAVSQISDDLQRLRADIVRLAEGQMRKLVVWFGLMAALLMLPTMAQAQTVPNRGTPEDQKACSGDARRHCRAVLDQGDMAVLACLQQQQRKLTRKCRAVLRKHGQ
jgi:hypothetical protein